MILLVDNYDSYTYNLAHLVAAVAGELPLVVPAGAVHRDRIPQRVRDDEFSHVLISPGPGSADNAADFSGSAAVIAAAGGIPLLGVCLGHQGLAWLAGSAISAAPAARHGFISRVRHSGEGIFADLPQDFRVVRYHSLQVAEADLAAGVEVHARSEDGVVQGLRVSGQPHWGVQFHPESVLSEHGEALMRNFLALAPAGGAVSKVPAAHTSARPAGAPPHRLRLKHRVVVGELDCRTRRAGPPIYRRVGRLPRLRVRAAYPAAGAARAPRVRLPGRVPGAAAVLHRLRPCRQGGTPMLP